MDKQEFQELGSPSNNEENTLDLTDEISKEILLHLRIRLGKANQEEQYFNILKVLGAIIANLVKDPIETKYHTLKLSNKKIQETITCNMECVNLLEVLGFQQRQDMVS